MKRFLLVLILLCLFALPAFAQEVTPEPPPVVVVDPPAVDAVTPPQLFNTALIVIGAIVTVALGVFGYIVRPAIVGAVAGMPQWGAEMLFSAGDAGLDALEDYAETTETTIDDDEAAKLRREFNELREEVRSRWQTNQG